MLRIVLAIVLAPRKPSAWMPPVVRTVATTGEGAAAALAGIERHHAWIGRRAAPGAS